MRNWKALFANKKFVLIAGRDYTCSDAAICTQVRNHGSKFRRGTTIDDSKPGRIEVTVHPTIRPKSAPGCGKVDRRVKK